MWSTTFSSDCHFYSTFSLDYHFYSTFSFYRHFYSTFSSNCHFYSAFSLSISSTHVFLKVSFLLYAVVWGTFHFVGLGNVFAGSQSATWSTNIGSTRVLWLPRRTRI